MFVAISERSRRTPAPPSQRDTDRISETLRVLGCRVLEIPTADPDDDLTVEDYLAYLPAQDAPTPGLYNGFIPTMERYVEVYEACARRNVWLLNTPSECARALSLVESHEALEGMTATTRVVRALDELDGALDEVGLPAFLKGSVKALKGEGVDACVARTREDAHRIASELMRRERYTRGIVLVREWLDLRHVRTTEDGLPVGREFRVFVYRGEVVTHGYYWDGEDEGARLDEREEREVLGLARRAARALDVPYLAIDVGQTRDGRFVVIEPGDGQFAGLSQVAPLELFGPLVQRARADCASLD